MSNRFNFFVFCFAPDRKKRSGAFHEKRPTFEKQKSCLVSLRASTFKAAQLRAELEPDGRLRQYKVDPSAKAP